MRYDVMCEVAFMMTSFHQWMYLMACYSVAVLCISTAMVLMFTLMNIHTRSWYGLGHVYIGHGQHSVLRILLGIIEIMSGSFRSVSLSLRIVCNAVAGHVLLAVLVDMTTSAVSAHNTTTEVINPSWVSTHVV